MCTEYIRLIMISEKTKQDNNFLFVYMYIYCIYAQIQWQTVVCPVLFKVTM